MDIGTTIKGIRKGMNQNQHEFAQGVGITQTTLSHIERNKHAPNGSTIKKISNYSNIPVPLILMNSVEESDIAENRRDRFNSMWPAVMDLTQKIFQ